MIAELSFTVVAETVISSARFAVWAETSMILGSVLAHVDDPSDTWYMVAGVDTMPASLQLHPPQELAGTLPGKGDPVMSSSCHPEEVNAVYPGPEPDLVTLYLFGGTNALPFAVQVQLCAHGKFFSFAFIDELRVDVTAPSTS